MDKLLIFSILLIGAECMVECPIKGSGFGLKFYAREDAAIREELNVSIIVVSYCSLP